LPVCLYSVQRASASSAETRRRVVVVAGFIGTDSLKNGKGSGGLDLYRVRTP
jgi:hypothetical protein